MRQGHSGIAVQIQGAKAVWKAAADAPAMLLMVPLLLVHCWFISEEHDLNAVRNSGEEQFPVICDPAAFLSSA